MRRLIVFQLIKKKKQKKNSLRCYICQHVKLLARGQFQQTGETSLPLRLLESSRVSSLNVSKSRVMIFMVGEPPMNTSTINHQLTTKEIAKSAER